MVMDLSEPAKGEPYRGIVWFNTRDDSYAIAEHNLGVDYREVLEKHLGQGLPAYLFEHKRRHLATTAEECRTCYRIAQRGFRR